MLMSKNKTLRQVCGVLETLNFLMLRLAVKNRSQWRLYPGMVFRDYMSLVQRDKWLSRDIFDIVDIPDDTRVTLEHLPGQGIGTPIDELAYLALLTKACQPTNVFEIGTFRGRTALNFALNSPEHCTVYTLDLPPDERKSFSDATNLADTSIIQASATGQDYKGKDEAKKIRQLYGNSLTFDYSPYAGAMDIVFVDGAHHYEAVVSDTNNALKMAKTGGFIIWHDFANYGDYHDVTRAILDLLPPGKVTQIANTQLAVYRVE